MKPFFRLVSVIALMTSSAAFAASEVKATINGMVCAFCSQGITKKFLNHESVESVKVNLTDKNVTVRVKDGKKLSDEEITEIITGSGFAVVKIERK